MTQWYDLLEDATEGDDFDQRLLAALPDADTQPGDELTQAPVVRRMLSSVRYTDEQKLDLLEAFNGAYDRSKAKYRVLTENDSLGYRETRGTLTNRYLQSIKDSWFGIEGIPTISGSLARASEVGTAQRNLTEMERRRLANMKRELAARKGESGDDFEPSVYMEWPTAFLEQQVATLERSLPEMEAKATADHMEGMRTQMRRAGEFAAMPEWRGWREGTVTLLGNLTGSAGTPEVFIPIPGFAVSPTGPILKVAAKRALVGGTAAAMTSLATEPFVQETAALNFAQNQGFSTTGATFRAATNFFLNGFFNFNGELASRFLHRFGVSPEAYRGMSPDETYKAIAEKTGSSRTKAQQDLGEVFAEYAKDIADVGPDTHFVKIVEHDKGKDVVALPMKETAEVPRTDVTLETGRAVSETTTSEITSPPGMEERKFAETLRESPLTADDIRKELVAFYDPLSNRETLQQAQGYIDEVGEEVAKDALKAEGRVMDALWGAIGQDLLRRYQNAKQWDKFHAVAETLWTRATTQGQFIQSLSMWNRMTPEGVLVIADRKLAKLRSEFPLKKIADLTDKQRDVLVDLVKQASGAKDPMEKMYRAAVLDMTLNSMTQPVGFWSKVRTARVLAMLANAKTINRNILGNQILWIGNLVADFVDVPVDISVSALRVGFTGGKPVRTNAIPSVTAKLQGFLDPLRETVQGFKMGWSDETPTTAAGWTARYWNAITSAVDYMATLGKLTSQNKFELSTVKNLNRWVFDNPVGRAIEKTVAFVMGVPDRAYWWSAVRGSIDEQMKIATLNGTPVATPTREMIELAYADGMKAIFQDPNVVAKATQAIRQKGLNLDQEFGLGDVLLTFAQVPSSLLVRGLEWTQAGYIRNLYEVMRPVLKHQEFRQKEFVEAFTRASIGTVGLVQTGHWLAQIGVMTGREDADPDVAAYQRMIGMARYRVNVSTLKRKWVSGDWGTRDEGRDGDVILSYDWAQPLSMALAIGAELYQQEEAESAKGKRLGAGEQAGKLLLAMASGVQTLTELSLLQGLNGFITAGVERGWPDALWETLTQDLPSSFVPTVVNQIGQYIDNTVYQTLGDDEFENIYGRVAGRIPGLAKAAGYPPSRDVYGEIIKRYPNVAQHSFFNVFANPTLVGTLREDPLGKELIGIYEATGERTPFPRRTPWKLTVNGKPYTLSLDEKNNYQQFVGRLTRDIFTQLVAAPAWVRLPEDAKANFMANALTSIHQSARILLLGDRPESVSRLTQAMAGKAKQMELEGTLFDQVPYETEETNDAD